MTFALEHAAERAPRRSVQRLVRCDLLENKIRSGEMIGRHSGKVRSHYQRPRHVELRSVLVKRQESLQWSHVLEGTRAVPWRSCNGGIPPRGNDVHQPIFGRFI